MSKLMDGKAGLVTGAASGIGRACAIRFAYPLYEVIAEHWLPAVFHTGQTAVGSGQRAGGGILLKYSNPLCLDKLAAWQQYAEPMALQGKEGEWRRHSLSSKTF